MKIFISGATGFVGGHLAENLIKENHEIKTLVRKSSDVSFIKTLGVDITYGDITDYASVKAAMEGCELVYHAASSRFSTSIKYPVYYDVNVKGTRNVMHTAIETGVSHVVYCSTVGVYGWSCKIPVDENTPLNPNGLYSKTKLEGERLVSKYCDKYGISAVIARLTSVYGPRDFFWLKLFQDIVKKRFIMIGSGKSHHHITYIDDIVQGLKLCGKMQNSSAKSYIIGSKEIPTVAQIVKTIAEESGVHLQVKKIPAPPFAATYKVFRLLTKGFSTEPLIMRKINFFIKEHMYDISKARNELNYLPKISLREGIKQTLCWYLEYGYL